MDVRDKWAMKYRNKKITTTTIHTDHLLYLHRGVNKKCQKAFNLLASLWYFRLHILNCAIESCVCDGFYCCCCYICQFEIFNGLHIHAPKIYHFIESKYFGRTKKMSANILWHITQNIIICFSFNWDISAEFREINKYMQTKDSQSNQLQQQMRFTKQFYPDINLQINYAHNNKQGRERERKRNTYFFYLWLILYSECVVYV